MTVIRGSDPIQPQLSMTIAQIFAERHLSGDKKVSYPRNL